MQLLFNLIAVATIITLAMFCVQINREKNIMITELIRKFGRNKNKSKPKVILEAKPVPEPSLPTTPEVPPAPDQDIRRFVARRIDRWTAKA